MPYKSEKVYTSKLNLDKYIQDNLYVLNKKDRLLTRPETIFYFDAKRKKVFQYPTSNSPNPVTPTSISDYISVSGYSPKETFNPKEYYELLYEYLKLYAKYNVYGYEYVKYMDEIYPVNGFSRPTIFHEPEKHFIMYNNSLCFQTNYNILVPITEYNFDYCFLNPQCLPAMTHNLKRKIVYALQHILAPRKLTITDPLCLYDNAVHRVAYEYNPTNDEHNFISLPLSIHDNAYVNRLPHSYIRDEYCFDKDTIALLKTIIGDNKKNLDYLAKLTTAVYSNGNPLKKATIIIADEASAPVVGEFIKLLFEEKICILERCAYQNIVGNYSALILNTFSKLLIIDDNLSPANYEDIRKIVNSTYFTYSDKIVGKIKFKFTSPLLVITQSEEYAKQFSIQVNSNIIRLTNITSSIQSITDSSISHLRQALALYGLRTFYRQKPEYKEFKNNLVSDEEIIQKFINTYCYADKNGYVVKAELRENFSKYTNAHYPYFKKSDISVCNALRNLGYNDRQKKRVPNYENPMHIIEGITFSSLKFEKDMKNTVIPEEPIEKSNFDEILSLLQNSKITTVKHTLSK